jgi:hypothetical protein
MRLCFCTKPKSIEFEADLDVIPRVGEHVVRYDPEHDGPSYYRVTHIVHTYDSRKFPDADPSEPHVYIRLKKSKDPFARCSRQSPR